MELESINARFPVVPSTGGRWGVIDYYHWWRARGCELCNIIRVTVCPWSSSPPPGFGSVTEDAAILAPTASTNGQLGDLMD